MEKEAASAEVPFPSAARPAAPSAAVSLPLQQRPPSGLPKAWPLLARELMVTVPGTRQRCGPFGASPISSQLRFEAWHCAPGHRHMHFRASLVHGDVSDCVSGAYVRLDLAISPDGPPVGGLNVPRSLACAPHADSAIRSQPIGSAAGQPGVPPATTSGAPRPRPLPLPPGLPLCPPAALVECLVAT